MRFPRALRAAGLSLLAFTAPALVTVPASATQPAATASQDGLWYYEVPGLADIHASGTRGEGVTIAVIDGLINPDAPDLVGADLTVQEDSLCPDGSGGWFPAVDTGPDAIHATNMASLIVGTGAGADGLPGVLGVAPDATVLHYAVMIGDPEEDGGQDLCPDIATFAEGMDLAVAAGADILSMSISAGWSMEVEQAVARALRAGVVIVAAASSGGDYPGRHNGVVTVQGSTADGTIVAQGMNEPDVIAPGEDIRSARPAADGTWSSYELVSGSSTATAWTSGVLALAWSAHPDATGNQMIQTLLRHTDRGTGELGEPDLETGFGYASVEAMLDADPTAYPDTNPLLREDDNSGPDIEDVLGEASETQSPTEPTAEPSAGTSPTPDSTAKPAESTDLVPILGGALAVVALAVVAILLVRRRTSRPTAGSREDIR